RRPPPSPRPAGPARRPARSGPRGVGGPGRHRAREPRRGPVRRLRRGRLVRHRRPGPGNGGDRRPHPDGIRPDHCARGPSGPRSDSVPLRAGSIEVSPMPPDPEQSDDIEILEVVGVDEDGIPVETEDPEDVEVVFEDLPVAPAGRRPAPPTEDPALKERFLRLQADFENYKKRIERERSDYFRHATSGLVARLLPVLDNFERALAATRGRPDALTEGVVLIQRQLLEEL